MILISPVVCSLFTDISWELQFKTADGFGICYVPDGDAVRNLRTFWRV